METEQEIWVGIADYENIYHVSNHGRVRVCKRIITRKNGMVVESAPYVLSMHKRDGGYYVYFRVNYVQKCFMVHRLVASVFVENKTTGKLVKHIDGNKYNNHYTNLEWIKKETVFPEYNRACGYVHLKKQKKNKTVQQYTLDGTLVAEWNGVKQAADAMGVNHASISRACSGIIRTTQGFVWCLKPDDDE